MEAPIHFWEKLEAKMHPTSDKKTPVALMDYLFGPCLELDVAPGEDDPKHPERKEREISYSLCEFETEATPVIDVNGESLFSEEDTEFLEKYTEAKSKSVKGKTAEIKKKALDYIEKNQEKLKSLYRIALNYLKENAFDIVAECGYHEWDAALTARVNAWLDKVSKMIDPVDDFSNIADTSTEKPQTKVVEEDEPEDEPEDDDVFSDVADEEELEGDLPF
jgi:hypothetical protein